MLRGRVSLAAALLLFAGVRTAEAQFDWGGGCGGGGGSGSFNQPVAYRAILDVGEIISGLRDVKINLRSDTDIDVQLYDKTNGNALVKWPDGWLNGPGQQSLSYGGVTITWSGYNGDGTGWGNEYIHITGTTNRSYLMKVYGYQSGSAAVNYSWTGGGTNSGNCDGGSGTFQQQINYYAVVDVGEIPVGLQDVYISLASSEDVDIQLFDKDSGAAIVEWPGGILAGVGPQTTTYRGMNVVWSGYNGDQIAGRYGYEFIAIRGATTRTLVMKAFGYNAGYARVDYEWGKRAIIYAGIQGAAAASGIWDGSTEKVIDADGCSEIRNVVENYVGTRNPNNDSDLKAIAQSNLGGLLSLGYAIGCGSSFAAKRYAAVYDPGSSTLVKLDIERYYNEEKKRARVYLAGFSAGGGDIQNLGYKLRDLGIPVQLSVHIDSIDISWDERIAKNVKRAMGFFQNEANSWLARGEDGLRPEFGGNTFVTNTQLSSPQGPESAATFPNNYQHRNMDNDERSWRPFLEYLNLHR